MTLIERKQRAVNELKSFTARNGGSVKTDIPVDGGLRIIRLENPDAGCLVIYGELNGKIIDRLAENWTADVIFRIIDWLVMKGARRNTIIVGGRKMHIISNMPFSAWAMLFGTGDFKQTIIDRYIDGSVKPDETTWYWLCENGAVCETDEPVEYGGCRMEYKGMTEIEILFAIYRMVLEKPDEILDELDDPCISVGLPEDMKLESVELRDGEFIDELFGDLQETEDGYGLTVCVSKSYEDGCYRVDEYEIDYMPFEDLVTIYEYLKNRI